MKTYYPVILLLLSSLLFFSQCTKNNPDPTGSFRVDFTGDVNETFEGIAYFRLTPSGENGILNIRLDQSNAEYMRLTFLNPDPLQIFLEPDTYNVVTQLGNDISREVLIDFINETRSFTANSGQVTVGISKNTQITGQLLNVKFDLANTTANGNYDAIPE